MVLHFGACLKGQCAVYTTDVDTYFPNFFISLFLCLGIGSAEVKNALWHTLLRAKRRCPRNSCRINGWLVWVIVFLIIAVVRTILPQNSEFEEPLQWKLTCEGTWPFSIRCSNWSLIWKWHRLLNTVHDKLGCFYQYTGRSGQIAPCWPHSHDYTNSLLVNASYHWYSDWYYLMVVV